MFLAKVVGTVVATKKVAALKGQKLLLIEHWQKSQHEVAVDTVQAGEGDVVTCVGSKEAALALEPNFVPVDSAIIGIVD